MPFARFRTLVPACLAAVVLAGCVNAGAPGSGRVQLVSDLANRIDRSASLTYTASYRLPGGAEATISQAQNPTRSAYAYPGGKLILTPGFTATCTVSACTLTGPASSGTDPAAALTDTVPGSGLIAPVMVTTLLTAAAMDGDALVTTHDTTLAGQSATCVQIGGVNNAAASDFDVCVTTDGVLGSFDGIIGGEPISITLDRYDQTVAPDAFNLPPGATVVDKRPK